MTFTVPTTRFAFSDRSLTKVVGPGDVEIWVAASAGEKVDTAVAEGIVDRDTADSDTAAGSLAAPVKVADVERAIVTLTGDVHRVSTADARVVTATISR